MDKKCFFFIDDVIWVFRDLTRQRPGSMFDNPFLGMLKEGHDKYGMKVQLNIFYRTDFFYGEDEFSLSEMTDAYKSEWEEASDWLKLGFHAKQEFPDYPYVNADYETVKINMDRTKQEVFRFAGENSFAYGAVTHWLPMSKEGVMALHDGGIKVMSCSAGERREYTGDPQTLPYGHSFRFLHNKKPETMLYNRGSLDVAIDNSICAYNHLSQEDFERTKFSFDTILDEETGMHFKRFTNVACINLCDEEYLVNDILKKVGKQYLCYATHEQYFYEDYFSYQPDFPAKVLAAARTLYENGYTYFFVEELVD